MYMLNSTGFSQPHAQITSSYLQLQRLQPAKFSKIELKLWPVCATGPEYISVFCWKPETVPAVETGSWFQSLFRQML